MQDPVAVKTNTCTTVGLAGDVCTNGDQARTWNADRTVDIDGVTEGNVGGITALAKGQTSERVSIGVTVSIEVSVKAGAWLDGELPHPGKSGGTRAYVVRKH